MIDRVVQKPDLMEFLDRLAAERVVAAPVAGGPLTRFQPIHQRSGDSRALPSHGASA